MELNLYFNETCDPVDLKHCSQYYVDPCDCTKFYQCAQNQLQMFSQPCGPGTIYNHKTLVCDHPNDAICQPMRPWERCNVTESRMQHLLFMCHKIVTSTSNTSNSDQNTNGIKEEIMMQTILPTVFGVLVLVMLIGLVIYRYKRPCDPVTPERPYDNLDPSRMTRERISIISDGSVWTERLTRNDEIHLSDPYNSYPFFGTSTPEYCPCETQRFNPIYDVDLNQNISDSSRTSGSSYIYVSQPDSVVHPSTMPQPHDVQTANTQEGDTVSSGDESDSSPSPSTMTGASDAYRECIARGVQNVNRPEGELVSNEDRSYSIAGESDTTPQPLAISRSCDADGPVQSWNTQEDEIASIGGSSYVLFQESDRTAMPQPSDADGEFLDITVSSENSAYVDVQQSYPLFHPYISGNGPWRHKVIFSIKEHYFPSQVD